MLVPKNARTVERAIFSSAWKHDIHVKHRANVGNHLHLVIKTRSHRRAEALPQLRAFMRELAGRIAFEITGAKKGRAAGYPFWDLLPYSRIVDWGRPLEVLARYLAKNTFQAVGVRDREIVSIRVGLREAGFD